MNPERSEGATRGMPAHQRIAPCKGAAKYHLFRSRSLGAKHSVVYAPEAEAQLVALFIYIAAAAYIPVQLRSTDPGITQTINIKSSLDCIGR